MDVGQATCVRRVVPIIREYAKTWLGAENKLEISTDDLSNKNLRHWHVSYERAKGIALKAVWMTKEKASQAISPYPAPPKLRGQYE